MFRKTAQKPVGGPQMESGPETGYPLFFHRPHVISQDRHAEAKLKNGMTLDFARSTNSIPLTAADMAEAAKHYPLAFTLGPSIIPVAIVGLEQENYFIDPEGKWAEGRYVPAYIRKYPFVFMEMPESDQLTLCIDEAALTFGSHEGMALYENQRPSVFTHNALEFCAAYQEQHRLTREFCEALRQKEMLLPQRSDVTLANGRKVELGGFQLIDIEKFKSLSEAEAFDWYRRGWLALAYYMLQSQSNWALLLDLGNKREGRNLQ